MKLKLIAIIFLISFTVQIPKKVTITFKKSKKLCYEIHIQKPNCEENKRHITPNYRTSYNNHELIICPSYSNLEHQSQMIGALVRLNSQITYKIPFNFPLNLIYESASDKKNCNYKGFKNFNRANRFDNIKGVFDSVLYLNKKDKDKKSNELKFEKKLPPGYIFEDFRNGIEI